MISGQGLFQWMSQSIMFKLKLNKKWFICFASIRIFHYILSSFLYVSLFSFHIQCDLICFCVHVALSLCPFFVCAYLWMWIFSAEYVENLSPAWMYVYTDKFIAFRRNRMGQYWVEETKFDVLYDNTRITCRSRIKRWICFPLFIKMSALVTFCI